MISFKEYISEAYKKNTSYIIETEAYGTFEVAEDKTDTDSLQEIEFKIEADVSVYEPSAKLRVQKGKYEMTIKSSKVYFNEDFMLGKIKFRKGQEVTDQFIKKYCDTFKSLKELLNTYEDELYSNVEDNM